VTGEWKIKLMFWIASLILLILVAAAIVLIVYLVGKRIDKCEDYD